jgi:hypothetical protein
LPILLGKRIDSVRDVVVGTVEHPQLRTIDFYRELGVLRRTAAGPQSLGRLQLSPRSLGRPHRDPKLTDSPRGHPAWT